MKNSRNAEEKKFVTVSGIIRKVDYERLKKLCRERGITVNHFIRFAVYQILGKKEAIKPNPILEALEKLGEELRQTITDFTVKVNEMDQKLSRINDRLEKKTAQRSERRISNDRHSESNKANDSSRR